MGGETRRLLGSTLVAGAVGLTVGWLLWGNREAQDIVARQTQLNREAAWSSLQARSPQYSDPSSIKRVEWTRFDSPQTPEDRAYVKQQIREALELNKRFPMRMIAVAELLSHMNKSNAHTIREAFDESWEDGYNFSWERALCFSRYGELLGDEAANAYVSEPEFGRIAWSSLQARSPQYSDPSSIKRVEWTRFDSPQTPEDRAYVKQQIREALELNKRFPMRMIAVAELLSHMNKSNAHTIREAFDESWEDGYNFSWERALCFSRYGELLGDEAANAYVSEPEFGRIVVSWAQVSPEDAITWLNEMEEEGPWEKAVDSVIFGAGQNDPSYGFQVFEQLEEGQQRKQFSRLFSAYQRAGGAPACADLCTTLLDSENKALRDMGTSALRKTLKVYREGNSQSLHAWLSGFDADTLSLFTPEELPEAFRPVVPGSP